MRIQVRKLFKSVTIPENLEATIFLQSIIVTESEVRSKASRFKREMGQILEKPVKPHHIAEYPKSGPSLGTHVLSWKEAGNGCQECGYLPPA